MRHFLFPTLLACLSTILLADVAPEGCARRQERPRPPGPIEAPTPPLPQS